MRPEKARHERPWYILFILLAMVLPALTGYVVYEQMRAPVFDAHVDWGNGTILEVKQDSFANWAGFKEEDVILSVDGTPFPEWSPASVGNYPAQVRRGGETITLELPLVPLAKINLPSLLSGVVVALVFWASGLLLLLRQFQQQVVRLFFLLSQAVGIAILPPLAYPAPLVMPDWIIPINTLRFQLAAPLLLHYCATFPVQLGNSIQRRWWLGLFYGLGLATVGIRFIGLDPTRLATGWYSILVVIGAITVSIYVYRRRADPDGRRRLRLVIFGIVLAILPSIFFYFVPLAVHSPYRMPEWLVGLFLVVAPLSYLYAIAQHHLFGIDRLLNRTLVYAGLSLGILLLYMGPFLLIYRFAPGDWLAQMMVAAGLTLAVGLAFERTKNALQRLVDRLFYGGWYDYPGVIEQVSESLARCIERKQLSDALTRQVPALMQLQGGDLLFEEQARPSPSSTGAQYSLSFQGRPRALWAISPHRDGDDLTDSDQRILDTLARQAEIALGNVLLIETLRAQLNEIRASREALTQAQRRLLHSREEERARLARDLHDGPLQALIGLNLQLGLLLPQAGDPAALNEMRAEVRDLLTDLRGVCAELRPPMLDTLGLGAALRALAEDWSTQHKIAVSFDLPPDAALRALPAELAVNLYRVAQEAFSNIARHTTASQVNIELTWESDELNLCIRDNGCGFNPPEDPGVLTVAGHFGLMGMQERAALIGAELCVESAPGEGTAVCVVWCEGGALGD